MVWTCDTSKPTASDTSSTARPHFRPSWTVHWLDRQHSNTWVYEPMWRNLIQTTTVIINVRIQKHNGHMCVPVHHMCVQVHACVYTYVFSVIWLDPDTTFYLFLSHTMNSDYSFLFLYSSQFLPNILSPQPTFQKRASLQGISTEHSIKR